MDAEYIQNALFIIKLKTAGTEETFKHALDDLGSWLIDVGYNPTKVQFKDKDSFVYNVIVNELYTK